MNYITFSVKSHNGAGVLDGVFVGVGVGITFNVKSQNGAGVEVGVGVVVGVTDGIGVFVGVIDGVGVIVGVGVVVGVTGGTGVAVGVGYSICGFESIRPRCFIKKVLGNTFTPVVI